MTSVTNGDFLEAVFVDAEAGACTIVCSFLADPYAAKRSAWFGRPWAPGDRLPHWFDEGNTYLTVSTFRPDQQTGECRRRKANFAAIHAVMVDDIGTKVQSEKLHLEPSALIETSPGNYQAYYLLEQDDDTRNRGLCERLIERMVAAGLTADGRDPGMKGVTRYGRLPVGINNKPKYVEKLGKPFAVRCQWFDPGTRYTIRQIAEAWKLDLSEPKVAFTNVVSITPALAKRAGEKFSSLIEVFKGMGMYHEQRGAWHDVTCPWIHTHTDRADTGTAIAEPSADNRYAGGFRCHHGHCENRTMRDVRAWLHELVRLLDEQRRVN